MESSPLPILIPNKTHEQSDVARKDLLLLYHSSQAHSVLKGLYRHATGLIVVNPIEKQSSTIEEFPLRGRTVACFLYCVCLCQPSAFYFSRTRTNAGSIDSYSIPHIFFFSSPRNVVKNVNCILSLLSQIPKFKLFR